MNETCKIGTYGPALEKPFVTPGMLVMAALPWNRLRHIEQDQGVRTCGNVARHLPALQSR